MSTTEIRDGPDSMDPRRVEDCVVRSPRIGSRLSEIIQNMQKQQAASTERSERRPIVVRDIVVAVMGATGAGKSTFIRRVTGNDTVVVGDGLKSVTQQMQPFQFQHEGKHFSIVDTPGFNDTHRSDSEVLKELAQWLDSFYRDGQKISGILYLHSISAPRMSGSALRNLRMFRKLCGEEFMKNVVLGTTFWDVVGEDVGTSREAELLETEGFFKDMQDRGCEVVRISNDRDECLQLLARFSAKQPSVMRIQKELFEGKSLTETAAASAISQELADLQSRNNKMYADVEQQLQRKTMKFELEQAYSLQLDRRAHEEKMGDLAAQQEELRLEMSHKEAQSDERLASASRVMSQQNQGYRIELDKLSEQLRALKAGSRN
ncbi:hypothetical protein LTR72_005589 [Exophiala xenobiotica]|nr:hypothetical protein LTR72_005589 [Exophiala xenobiotica]KAK5297429.1 hypothetical protein LTR14_003160 [Exophiala xenobiotica]KAK5485753.1 hypothetical protein LTR55_005431 [Exophiala xenobiotica]